MSEVLELLVADAVRPYGCADRLAQEVAAPLPGVARIVAVPL
jgi:hypothetical protein